MSKQAKVLTAQEIRRVLDYVATRAHAERNRAMFLTMLYAIAYFSPSWTAFQAERGRDFSVIVDGISN